MVNITTVRTFTESVRLIIHWSKNYYQEQADLFLETTGLVTSYDGTAIAECHKNNNRYHPK